MLLNEVFGDPASPANLVRAEANALVRAISPEAECDLITRHYDDQTFIIVSLIRLPKELRKTGIGTKIMQALCQLADRNNAIMALSPSNEFGTSKAALVSFYKSFGFVANSGRNKDYRLSYTMIRNPKLSETLFTTLMK